MLGIIQGNRQGNDSGTQYRSGIYCTDEEQLELAKQTAVAYRGALRAARHHGGITTEIVGPPRVRICMGRRRITCLHIHIHVHTFVRLFDTRSSAACNMPVHTYVVVCVRDQRWRWCMRACWLLAGSEVLLCGRLPSAVPCEARSTAILLSSAHRCVGSS